ESRILLDASIHVGTHHLRIQVHVVHAQIVEETGLAGREEGASSKTLPVNVRDVLRGIALRHGPERGARKRSPSDGTEDCLGRYQGGGVVVAEVHQDTLPLADNRPERRGGGHIDRLTVTSLPRPRAPPLLGRQVVLSGISCGTP